MYGAHANETATKAYPHRMATTCRAQRLAPPAGGQGVGGWGSPPQAPTFHRRYASPPRKYPTTSAAVYPTGQSVSALTPSPLVSRGSSS